MTVMDLRSTVGLHSCYEGHCLPVDDRVVSADPEAWVGVQPREGDAVPADEQDMACGCGLHGCTAIAEAESLTLDLGGES